MNKKLNTFLFIGGATVFNIMVTMVSFILLTLVYVMFLAPVIPENNRSWGFSIIFVASLAIAFLVYRVVIKFIFTKYQIEDYMDPIFKHGLRGK